MRSFLHRLISCRASWTALAACGAMVLGCVGAACGQESLVYSFETDLEGFFGVSAGAITPSLETSGLGATDGSNSMKVVHERFNGFAGVRTTTIPVAFFDPLGLDFVRFDLTNTNRFAPAPTEIGRAHV